MVLLLTQNCSNYTMSLSRCRHLQPSITPSWTHWMPLTTLLMVSSPRRCRPLKMTSMPSTRLSQRPLQIFLRIFLAFRRYSTSFWLRASCAICVAADQRLPTTEPLPNQTTSVMIVPDQSNCEYPIINVHFHICHWTYVFLPQENWTERFTQIKSSLQGTLQYGTPLFLNFSLWKLKYSTRMSPRTYVFL